MKMFSIGESVMYGVHGVCTVVGTQVQRVDRKNVTYLVLQPSQQGGSRFYLPLENPKAMEKVRPILTRQELDALVQDEAVRAGEWIADENRRKLRYREILASGDRAALLQMIHTVHAHAKQQLSSGKKVHICDENFLRDAHRLVEGEFSAVLGIPSDQVAAWLAEHLGS